MYNNRNIKLLANLIEKFLKEDNPVESKLWIKELGNTVAKTINKADLADSFLPWLGSVKGNSTEFAKIKRDPVLENIVLTLEEALGEAEESEAEVSTEWVSELGSLVSRAPSTEDLQMQFEAWVQSINNTTYWRSLPNNKLLHSIIKELMKALDISLEIPEEEETEEDTTEES